MEVFNKFLKENFGFFNDVLSLLLSSTETKCENLFFLQVNHRIGKSEAPSNRFDAFFKESVFQEKNPTKRKTDKIFQP